MSKKLKWPLCADVFTIWDKLKICKFLFTEKIWTYGEYVKNYEDKWSNFLSGKSCKNKIYSIVVSSGSTANELIALRRKWELEKEGNWPLKNKVVFPVNTWASSVTPWIFLGFEPVFMDIQLRSLNSTSSDLRKILINDSDKNIGTVFYTSILGFFEDIGKCKKITEQHGAKFLMDNCEAAFSKYWDYKVTNEGVKIEYDYLLNFVTCSLSCFYSHHTTSGTELGIVFTKNEEEADWYRMARNHGMTRGMPNKYKNKDVNPLFDFYLQGSNYRSSNLQCYMASLDFDRATKFSLEERPAIFREFYEKLDTISEIKPFIDPSFNFSPLAIPIIFHSEEVRKYKEKILNDNGIVTRPIIGGNLLYHTAFKKYGNPEDFPMASIIHKNGIYLGLNANISNKIMDIAADIINDQNYNL